MRLPGRLERAQVGGEIDDFGARLGPLNYTCALDLRRQWRTAGRHGQIEAQRPAQPPPSAAGRQFSTPLRDQRKMTDYVLNNQTANQLDPIIAFGRPDVNGNPAFSRKLDAAELGLRPAELARIHVLPLHKQRPDRPPVPNMIFFAVRQIDPRPSTGWRVEHFMCEDQQAAKALGLDMERFRMVWAEAREGSDEDRNNFALKTIWAFAAFDASAAAILRGLVVPDQAKIDVFFRAQLIPR